MHKQSFFSLMPLLVYFYFCGLWNEVLALVGLYFFCILSMFYHQCLRTFEFVFIFNTRVRSGENYLFFPVERGEGKVGKTLVLGGFPGSPVVKTELPPQGPWVWYLVVELRSYMAQLKNKTLFLITLVAAYEENKIMEIIPGLLLKI